MKARAVPAPVAWQQAIHQVINLWQKVSIVSVRTTGMVQKMEKAATEIEIVEQST